MNLARYLSNRLQEIAVDVNKVGGSLRLGAEADAVQFIFNAGRFLFAVPFVPIVFLNYMLVCLRLKRVPAPALELMQAEARQAETMRKQKLGKKVGIQPGTKIPGGNMHGSN